MSRRARGGAFCCVDSLTGKRTSLGTSDRDAAEQIVLARNQALRQPSLNLHLAKAYLAGSDSGVNTRTWGDGIRDAVLIETRAEALLEAIRRGTVSTNVHLRKLHSYRYAWAERARTAGYPERFAQEALGHNSKAVHRACARHAEVTLPALEEHERKTTGRKVVAVRFTGAPASAPTPATEATTRPSAS